MAWATSTPTGRLKATMPPKAATGSPAWALRKASSTWAPRPTPQGLLCLTMTAEGALNWNTDRAAASTSSRLLKLSSLPWSWRQAEKPSSGRRGARRRPPAGGGSRRSAGTGSASQAEAQALGQGVAGGRAGPAIQALMAAS